jgi:hypothetical protein
MKRKLLLSATLLVLLASMPALSYGYTYNYFWDFSTGLPAAFQFTNDLPGIIQLDDTQGNLRIYSSGFVLSGGQVKGASVGSTFAIGGDFDISIHYQLNTLYNGTQAHFAAGNFPMLRSYENGNNNYHVWLGGWQGTTPTSDMQGTMEIKRTGGTIQALVNGSPIFTYAYGTGDVSSLGFNIDANTYGGWGSGVLDIIYDNLSVQCDTLPSGPPVPLPGTALLLASGLTALAGIRRLKAR